MSNILAVHAVFLRAPAYIYYDMCTVGIAMHVKWYRYST